MYRTQLWIDAMAATTPEEPEVHIDLYRDFELSFVPSVGMELKFFESPDPEKAEEYERVCLNCSEPTPTIFRIEKVMYFVDSPSGFPNQLSLRSTMWYESQKDLLDIIKILVYGYKFTTRDDLE